MDPSSYRRQLHEIFAEREQGVHRQVQRALAVGAEYLDLPIGFFTRIEDGTQEIVRSIGDHEGLQPGRTCPLEDAYCRRTVERDAPLAVQDVDGSTVDPGAVEAFGLGAYIGATVVVDGGVYGTVCFADTEGRDRPFTESEELFLELLANLVGSALEQRAHERDLRTRNERLEREKQRFEVIAESSLDVIFRLGMDGRFTYVSAAVERVLGYAPETLLEEPMSRPMAESAAEDAAAAFDRVRDGERVEGLKLDFLDRAGETVVLEVNAGPITEEGSVTGVLGVARDVTERIERESELQMKNRAMDEANIGIVIVEPPPADDTLVYVNEGFERLTGYDAETVLGRNCRFLQGEGTDQEATDELRAAIDAEEATTVELVNYRRDGTPFWNQVQLSPVFDDGGELLYYLGFQRDVTERRRTEQLVRLLNRVLRHNLRNKMTALNGWADMLRHGEAATPRDVGARIDQVTDEILGLTEHARELERYASDERDPRRLDPAEILSRVVATHRDASPAAAIDVAVRTDRGICAGPELERALSELLENAIKHNPADEPTVTVTVRDDGEWIEVTVVDDGPGIEAMESAVISAGDETPLRHGSGLGLWLINWIVSRYGGSFRIDPHESGTTATIRLPAIDEGTPVAAVERGPTVLFR